VHQVIVPSATPPANANIRGCSAARSTVGADAPGTVSWPRAVIVSP
jgi:hypothetical protein